MAQTLGEKIAIFVNTESKAGRDIYSSQIDQLIADNSPTASPTESEKELIDRYEMELDTMCTVDFGADTAEYLLDPGQSRDFLTRFLAEARRDVDVEKVWAVLDANYPTLRCGSCGSVNIDPTARGWCIGHDGPTTPCETVTITKDELAAALVSVKGEDNGKR